MKKHLIKSLAFCILGLGTTNLSAQYCTGVGASNTSDSNVESVALTGDAATVINYTGCTGTTGVTGLDDQTATQSVSVTAGSPYTANIQFGTCGGPYAGAGEAWIDWNQNSVFDLSESIGTWSGIPPVAMSVFNFTVPAGALNGTTRMRVVQQEGGANPLNPCVSFTYGSTTDFSVVVSGGTTITCPSPSVLTTANITGTSVDLGWTENGTATLWAVEYGPQGFAPGTGMMMATAANPFNISGLMSNTAYQFYVSAVCAPGDSSTSVGPLNFMTTCPASFTPIYSEDFTTYLNPCWSEAQGVLSASTVLTGTTSNWTSASFGNAGTDNSARINLYSIGRDEWIVSPSIDLGTAATNYQLEFDIALTDYANTSVGPLGVDDTIAVVISTDNGATWQMANVLQYWLPGSEPSNTGDHIVIDLSSYTGVVKFGFYAASSVSNADNDIFVDNFLVTNLATCPAPNALTAMNITGTSADLGWTENGSALTWGIEYGPQGFAPGSGTMMAASTNPANVTGLMPATSYEFYVNSVCAPGDSSPWVGPFAFTTPCPAAFTPAYMTDFSTFVPNCWDQAADGNPTTGPTGLGSSLWSQAGNSARINLYTTTRSEWLLSPAFDLSVGGWELAINANATDYSSTTVFGGMGSDDTVQVLISTNGGTTWTPIYTWDAANPLTFATAEITVDLSAYTGTSNLFGIWAADGPVNDPEDYYALINSFEIRSLPVQADLVITEIMYNSPESGVDSLEFVEIYNNGAMPTDLTGYTLSGIAYTFPSVSLAAGGYYVVGINASAFNSVYGVAADGIATGGLSNGGETIMIRNSMGMVVDSVRYDDNAPWPSGSGAGLPDGGGSSVVLCDTASDNADGANWNASVASTGVMINGNLVLASPGVGNNCPSPLDVAVTGFYNLNSTYCNVATITGSVIITNMNSTDVANVPYVITANGITIGGGAITLLAGNTSDTITVGPLPATTGIANIVVMTSLAGDANTTNDMLSMTVTVSNTSATASVMTMIACHGDSTGAVMAVGSNGIGSYTYLWDANASLTNATLMNIPAGMHMVVVMDSIGCTDSAMVTLTEPTAIVATTTDNGDGTAYVTATGGTAPYTFLWDAATGNQTTDTTTALVNGTYSVTVTDANGCTSVATVTVVVVGLNNIANLSKVSLFPNPTKANVFVELELVENATVQINITNSIGQLVISKKLTNVQSEKVELNTSTLTSGVYMVQFTIGTELVTRKLIVSKQ